jgi:plastocyanin
MTRNPTLRRLLAATLVATALFGACGGGDDDSSGSSDEGATSEMSTPAADGTAGDAVQIVDFNFSPQKLQVEAGTTVTFTNEDGFAHTATAKDKSFDSGNLEQGGTFEHTFDTPGTYEYLCAIHNSMTGSVVVS